MILTVTMNPAIDKIYTVNNFELGEVHRPSDMIASAGGKGLNVARVVKLMGEEVSATGFLGGGNGKYISKKLVEQDINDRFVQIYGETRICINVTDTVSQQSTEVLESGPVVSEFEAERFMRAFREMIKDYRVVTISGSLPKGVESNFYAQMVEVVKNEGKKIILDSSSQAFIEGVKALPSLIKPNSDEVKAIYGIDSSSEDELISLIKKLQDQGIEYPMISRGKDGVIAGLSDGIYSFRIPPVDVLNTVGSGDSFIAGCAVAIANNMSEVDIVKMGTACGTANTQYMATGYVEKDKVEEFFNNITVEKLD